MSNPMRARTAAIVAAVCGLALAATPAAAQYDRGEWEWDEDQGWNREEWYDPTDWFDGDQTVDYETDWYETEYDDEGADDNGADDAWVTGSAWYDGYWDGYYDGYNDDQYGMDSTANLSSSYGDAYTSGYTDGYYDQDRGYTYDPYYYVYTWTYDNADRSERERAGDRDRQRGDRATPDQRRANRGNNTNRPMDGKEADKQWSGQKAKDSGAMAHKHREDQIQRVRGEVERIEFLRGTGSESGTALIARITFKEDGKKRVVNMGPKMSRSNVPFEEGDRVTLKGMREQHQDRQVLTVHRVNVDGRTARLSAAPDWKGQSARGEAVPENQRVMEGTIRSVSEVDADSERYTLLRIRLDNGKSGVIAVSDQWADGMDEFEAEAGDEIVIMGDKRTIEGRTVIRPHRIDVNGERLSMR
jgi:hypothetical protein